MDSLKGFQKRFLRGLAHALKPVVFVGQKVMPQKQGVELQANKHFVADLSILIFIARLGWYRCRLPAAKNGR